MAGVGGFEPPIQDPKSRALPLGHTPAHIHIIIYNFTANLYYVIYKTKNYYFHLSAMTHYFLAQRF